MNKYKIYVYAICKNEEKHIERWFNSMKEADGIYVLDTGSSDESVNILRRLGVNTVIKDYKNFKFDVARNDSLNLVPDDADICVCTDIDEVLSEGWREKLENIWDDSVDRVRYNMNFSFDDSGNPVSTYFISKIHKKNKYTWSHTIHEVLKYIGNGEEKIITTNEFTISHYPDRTKDRTNYLTLLENAVKENPLDDRDMHYLGREYMYNKEWNKCIDTLIKHLSLGIWDEERSASMRFISRAYIGLKRYDEAEMWLKKSIEETPYIREPYIELGFLYYDLNKNEDAIYYIEKGISISDKSPTYINEEFAWNETPYDLLGLCYYKINKKEEAIKNFLKALEINPNNERIKNNYKSILKEKESEQ